MPADCRGSRLIFAASILFIAPFLFSQQTPSQADTAKVPRIEKSACVVETAGDEKIECYTLITFENHAKRDGKTIKLPFMIFRSRGPHPAPDPVLWTAGGPGGSTLARQHSAKRFAFLDERDYIAFEQRGTQYAQPSLQCPEYIDASATAGERNLDHEQTAALKLEAARVCKKRFQEAGIDPSAYTTQESADDIEDLRVLLGVPQWNLAGLSYSTRLDLEVIRRYPATVRSASLESTLPPDVSYDDLAVSNILRSVRLVINNCSIDIDCARAFPQLNQVFEDLLQRFSKEHPVFSLKSPRDGKAIAFRMTSRNLIDALYVALYFPRVSIPRIPLMLWQAHNRDYGALQKLLQDNLGASNFAWGMRLSVWCHHEAALRKAGSTGSAPALGGFRAEAVPESVCREWDVPALPVGEASPVVSDVPVLFFAGEYDPDTPTEWAFHAAGTLKNSYVIQVPSAGHGQVSLDSECGRKIVTAWYNDPSTLPPLDCIASARKLPFVTKE